MLNLNTIQKNTYKCIWFDGSELEIRRPSQKLFEQLIEISSIKEDMELNKMMTIIFDLLYNIVNNNLNDRKFSKDEIREVFDLQTAYLLIEDYANSLIPELEK